MTPRHRTATRRERGSVTVELAILAPLVGILLAVIVVAGRVQIARANLEAAARSAARDLAIVRDPHAAFTTVRAGLETTLEVGSPTCRSMTFTPTISEQAVTVTVACVVDLDAASMLPVPGSVSLTAAATEVVDAHRERTVP